MIDVVDTLRELLEPPQASGVKHDTAMSQPLGYADDTIYAWPIEHRRVPVGTRELNGPAEIDERFAIRVVFTTGNEGEVADLQREREVSVKLDAKASAYLDTVSANGSTPAWDNINAAVDHDFIRQLAVRGVSLVVTGNRLRSS